MKKILFSLLLLCTFAAKGQHYYNEWIDYSKTYYKFKLAKTGLYRIANAELVKAGLGDVAAEHFQLWRNGKEVAIFTSSPSGVLPAAGYIEFWGQMNDGKPDKELYRKPEYQLNDKWSLETDSATYFLTVNTRSPNLHLVDVANNVAATTLPAEPYFMYTAGTYYRTQLNNGNFINVGKNLYASSYDNGEGWMSNDIDSAGIIATTYSKLFISPTGPDASLHFTAFGKAIRTRRLGVRVNGKIIDTSSRMDFFDAARRTFDVPLSALQTNTALIQIQNLSEAKGDAMVVGMHELTYPRLFDFGGAANFEFTMPAKSTESHLKISGFAYGTAAPVLYDLTNGQRYVGDLSAAPSVRFLISPSSTSRNFVLVKSDAVNTTAIAALQQRSFVDYTDAANSGDYLIITNERLLAASDGTNPVEEYRQYRNSAVGGGFNAKIYREDELCDQFGYGIKKNPIALRNFILYNRKHFAPKHVFLIGKGVNYVGQYHNQANADIDRLNLVPTFGWPASDALLTADPGSSIPQLSFGRLSAINANEITRYLKKVKEYEQAQQVTTPFIKDRGWMKNVVHLNGIGEAGLKETIDAYYEKYKNIITDTSFGGKVTTFVKSSTNAVEQISSTYLDVLFKEGISLMTYFGHSGSNTLEFSLDNPQAYSNQGKYPLFIALGCDAGDFFNFNTKRFIVDETISERYVLAPDRGTIGFIASTHYGIVHYLDVWNTQAYKAMAASNYGAPIGEVMVLAAKGVFDVEHEENFYAIANVEETEFHGDPAIRLNTHAKPDYVIEAPLVKTTPEFISVAEPFFKVACKILNIGKAERKNLAFEVKREYPGGLSEIVYRDTVTNLFYADSLVFNLPIDAIRDQGVNKLTVTIDAGNEVDELYESNNSVTKEIVIYADELRPVYPNNYAIVNKDNFKFLTSTADPFSPLRNYQFELDTTAFFNSPLKVSRSVSSIGGLISFDGPSTLLANTVYFWRVATIPDSGRTVWNTSSFTYMPDRSSGFSQSHVHEKLRSQYKNMSLDSSTRQLQFEERNNNIFIRHGVWALSTSQEGDVVVNVNGASYIRNTCQYSIVFNVFDKHTFKPWINVAKNGSGLYGTYAPCAATRINNFEFSNDTSGRRKAYEFIKNVPSGNYIVARIQLNYRNTGIQYVNNWIADEAIYGTGKTLYSILKQNGFSTIDSFNRLRVFAAVLRKDDPSYKAKQQFTDGGYDILTLSADCPSTSSHGTVTSPQFGPAKKWNELTWQGSSLEAIETDQPTVDVIGVKVNGKNDTLYKGLTLAQQPFDLSGVNTAVYPYLQLQLNDLDSVNYTPFQLDNWRLTHVPVAEGALAPNLYLNMKDTLEAGAPFDFQVAFKNISETPFDSLRIKMVLTDAGNVKHILPVQKHRPLNANDTLHVRYNIDTKLYGGMNTLYFEVNPDYDQPEQYHFNNYAFKNVFVQVDSLNPTMDVTFDNVHILNNDIISSKPNILIKLKDEAKWSMLTDTSRVKVQVRYPDATVRTYQFNSDTLQFKAAQAGSQNNVAEVIFLPHFEQDGNYELMVQGTDNSGNKAGTNGYRVGFEVINKAMISNLLNYPNPFTTSTAFVFTLTGSVVPQEFKIQVLTVTGKVVREITRQELGPLHIGRNITEYKWDGTDQYGQKLGNGVYLYRVVTGLNGKKLEQYKSTSDNTDQFFNKGYGKMYLMR